MKLIRITKMMAGPDGVRHPGQTLTVDNDSAAMLVDAGAAEVIADIQAADVLTPDIETAAVDPVVETAVQPKAKTKKGAA
jgi:hypothetical protein